MIVPRLAGAIGLALLAFGCQRENPTPKPNKPITQISFATDWKAQAEHGGLHQAAQERA